MCRTNFRAGSKNGFKYFYLTIKEKNEFKKKMYLIFKNLKNNKINYYHKITKII